MMMNKIDGFVDLLFINPPPNKWPFCFLKKKGGRGEGVALSETI